MALARATVSGATGLIGPRLIAALLQRGCEVTVLSREPAAAASRLRALGTDVSEIVRWDPATEPAPAQALADRDAIFHLAGESISQRWSSRAKRAIRDSRVAGTRQLVAGLADVEQRPRVLVCSSGIGYYGVGGEEPLDEESPAGEGFLAEVCAAWEQEARRAADLGVRVARIRTGLVLDVRGGVLASLLRPFKLGLGGPVAGGRHYMSWIHHDDLIALMIASGEDERFSGAINATAPEPVTNRDFSRALGRALHRPALVPVPGVLLGALLGEMSQLATTGARVLPAKALVLGFEFARPQLPEALRAALAKR
jgi:uncharacterized protein (TIGR01777 family)